MSSNSSCQQACKKAGKEAGNLVPASGLSSARPTELQQCNLRGAFPHVRDSEHATMACPLTNSYTNTHAERHTYQHTDVIALAAYPTCDASRYPRREATPDPSRSCRSWS